MNAGRDFQNAPQDFNANQWKNYMMRVGVSYKILAMKYSQFTI